MRLCADENVAPALSRLIRDNVLSRKHQLDTVDDYAARGVDDQVWVRRYADAGGEAIIGGDAAMMKKPHEIVAIVETGLRLVILDERWPRERFHVQASYLFYWWPHIEAVLENMRPGTAMKVPWGWGHPEDAIRPIQFDAQGAYKKLKRRDRPD